MRRPLCLLCLLFTVFLAALRAFLPPPEFSLGNSADKPAELSGVVARKEVREDVLIIYLKQVQITGSSPDKSTFYRNIGALCYLKITKDMTMSISQIMIGSTLSIRGTTAEFREATNPGEFDVREYYALSRIYFCVKDAVPIEVSLNHCPYQEALYRVKQYCAGVLDRGFSKENAGILKAMLLGDRAGMEEEEKLLYQLSGISHVLAISGLHISLLWMGVFQVLRRIGCKIWPAAIISMVFIVSYGNLVGSTPGILRAIGMFLLSLTGKLLKQSYDTLTAMALLALCVLWSQPDYIFYAGFQLSFGAILALAFLSPSILPESEARRTDKLKRGLLGSFCVFVVTLPIMLSNFYEVSAFGILWNLGVIPLMSFLLPAGITYVLLSGGGECLLQILSQSGIKAFLSPILRILPRLVAELCEAVLGFYSILCEWNLYLPFSVLRTGKPYLWQIFLSVTGMMASVVLGKKKKHRAQWAVLLCCCTILLIPLPREFEITFLDVGQGDCTCILTPKYGCVMIDGGSSSRMKVWDKVVLPYLKYKGVSTVNYWFVTHPDQDHYSAVLDMLQSSIPEIKVKTLVFSEASRNEATIQQLEELAKAQKIRVVYMKAGDRLTLHELSMECVYPENGEAYMDSNDQSLVLSMKYKGLHAVFAGDAGAEFEDSRAISQLKDVDILKVAHHGSAQECNGENYLKTLSPGYAIISCAAQNRYGHPHAEILQYLEVCGAEIICTKDCGAITVKLRHGISVYTFHEKEYNRDTNELTIRQ